MSNPCLVEFIRGRLVESRHSGSVAVCDSRGKRVFSAGDVARPVFPRSAVKALQAVPLVESGAADSCALEPTDLALCCSSHNAETRHVETARNMLSKAGRDESDLECGAQWPKRIEDQRDLQVKGMTPTAIHNNCSGKHSGFICLSCHLGAEPAGYIKPDHIVQSTVRNALEAFYGATLSDDHRGIDGCSIPTYAVPLENMARGFAVFGTAEGLDPDRAQATRRLRAACAAEPFQVAGTGRFCTAIMEHFKERVFIKTGAEGVFCAAFPSMGLGVALKCDDGASRASEVMMAQVIASCLPLEPGDEAFLAPYLHVDVRNWNGLDVGFAAPSAEFVRAMDNATFNSAV